MTDKEKILSFSAHDIEVQSTTNQMYIIGCIATVGTPSEGAPCGAEGHQIVISQESADKNIHTFVGQPMNCLYDPIFNYPDTLSGHGSQYYGMYCGYIKDAWQEDNRMMAKIVIWKDTFPELASTIVNAQRSLGFSVEMYVLASHDNDDLIVVDDWEGCGCALLWQNAAAFGEATYIEKLVASLQKGKKGKGDADMTKEEMTEIVSAISANVTKSVDEKIASLGIEELKASVEELKQANSANQKVECKENLEKQEEKEVKFTDELKEMIKAQMEEFKASLKPKEVHNDIPAPKSFTKDPDLGGSDVYKNKLDKIDASNLSIYDQIKAKTGVIIEESKDQNASQHKYSRLF